MGNCNCFSPRLGGCPACNDGLSTLYSPPLSSYPLGNPFYPNAPTYPSGQITYTNVSPTPDPDLALREAEIDTAKAVLLLAHRYRHKPFIGDVDRAERCEAFARELLKIEGVDR
jgi:hypothetical protein